MSLYIIEDDDGNVLDNYGEFDNLMINAMLYDEPTQAERDVDKYGGHVVTLTEEQKVKLPREVGEELDQFSARYVDVLQFVYHLYALSATEFPALVNWMYSAERRWVIIDAYRYGWEAEPEAKWYVQTPESWGFKGYYFCKHSNGQAFPENPNPAAFDSDWTQFTRAEIKQYHLDSDIFTLVPVEEDKEVSR